jgi:hypothetical protein
MGCAYYHAGNAANQCKNSAVVAVTRRGPGAGRLWFPVCESHFFAKSDPEWVIHSLRRGA